MRKVGYARSEWDRATRSMMDGVQGDEGPAAAGEGYRCARHG
jgi:hypothetical protein